MIRRPRNPAVLLGILCGLLASCRSDHERAASVAERPVEGQTTGGSYISWQEHRIDDQDLAGGVPLRGADGLQMADLDNDGQLDIISVHEDSHHVRVAYGSGDPDTWFRLSLAEGEEARAAEDVAIGDLNGDGFADAIVACERGHLLYLQNPGGRTRGNTVRGWRWDRVIPEVTRGRGSFIRVFFADLDGDGRLEVVATNKGTGRSKQAIAEKRETEISWFEAPDDPLDPTGWSEHVLGRVKVPINAQPVDLDGDGDLDVFAGSRGESRVLWFENVGDSAFEEHAVGVDAPSGPGAGELRLTGFNLVFHDFSGDGRLDVVLPAMPHAAVWLEQPQIPDALWKLHPIGSIEPDHLVGITLADITGDDRPDLLAGGYSRGPRLEDSEDVTANDPAGRLAWFENPGTPTGEWKRHDISRRRRGMFDAFLARDMDADGDIDFVGTRGNSGEFDGVYWLEQLHSETPVKAFRPSRDSESEPLPLP